MSHVEKSCGTCNHRGESIRSENCSPCYHGRGSDPRVINWAPRDNAAAPSGKAVPVPKGTDMLTAFAPAQPAAGRKDDGGKLDVTLLFNDLPHAIEAVTEVLQWAITKKQPKPYERGSWQHVPDFQRRYQAAQLRHELNRAKSAIAGKPETDHETGLLELAHVATDALFRLEMAIRKTKGLNVPEGA